MTDMLTRMRAMTPATLAGTRTDFDDAPRYHVAAPKDKGMTRIVEGADDLVFSGPRNQNPGMITLPDLSGGVVGHDSNDPCNNPACCPDSDMPVTGASAAQVNLIRLRLTWLAEHDADAAAAMTDWLDRGGWGTLEGGRGGSASNLIDRIKAKHEDARRNGVTRKVAVVETTQDYAGQPSFANVQHDEMPQKKTKGGAFRPMYYAVEMDGVVKYYRIKQGTKPGWWWIDAQASDEFHAVRNVGTKNTILRAIIAAGAEASMRLYGSTIGNCARCHRTLTDATSRANGIGPECEGML